MAPEEHVRKIEYIIGYNFETKQYIHEALTAAGAENDNYDGNRRLSQIGASLVDTILSLIVYGTKASRESTARLRTNFADKEHYATVVRQTGIADCICYDARDGSSSSAVLRKALNAVIAAVFLDTWNPKLTINVILNIFTHGNIKNGFLPEPSISTPATNRLSEGVDLLLDRWIDRPCCNRMVDGTLTGEFLNNAIDPNLWLGTQHSLMCAFEPPFMRASHDVTGCAAAEPLPAGDDWLSLPALGHNFEMGGLIDGLVELRTPVEVTHPINQQCMASETNAELFQQDETDYITSGSGFRGVNLSTNINMPSVSPDDYLERPSRSLVNPRKRKHAIDNSSSPPLGDFLQKYLSEEKQKCVLLGMQPPEETYFNLDVQNALLSLGHKHCEPLFTIFVTIASPRSIIALRDIIHSERTQRSPRPYLLRNGISRKARFYVIQELDQSVTFMQLMKWLHILELFQDCGGPGAQSYTGYVVNTPDNFGNLTKMPGNRRNWEDTQVTRSMLLEVFPEATDEIYRKMFPTFKKLRKLGKRLHTLSSKFGKGIFGLMLDCIPDSDSMTISDNLILDLNDSTFNTFVKLLESSQANILRKFSAAILPLLDSITRFTVHPEQPHKLENTNDQDIVSKAKGSDALLHLIS